MDIVLIHGLWLTSEAWRDVVPLLESQGHRVTAVALPGQGDGNTSATLDDQIDAVVAAVDAASGPVLVVGHSAASTLAWLAADRRPDRVAKVALVGGMPTTDGKQYAAFFDLVDGAMPFPGWGPFEGSDIADLDAETLEREAAAAVAVPGNVAHGVVHYGDPRRHEVPVVMVCPEYSPEEAKQWVEDGDIPELIPAQVTYVNLDTGHWTMFSAPDETARVIAELAV